MDMAAAQRPREIIAFVMHLGREATRRHGVPESLARSACAVTTRKFAAGDAWDTDAQRRARAYFWGVVRRRALGAGSDVAALRDRYVAATVAADMLEGGHPPDRVRQEVVGRFGEHALPAPRAGCYL
jgi:hypothetical protein